MRPTGVYFMGQLLHVSVTIVRKELRTRVVLDRTKDPKAKSGTLDVEWGNEQQPGGGQQPIAQEVVFADVQALQKEK